MPFNFMFSSSGLNALELSIEIHLFGLAYTYTKRLQDDETQEGGSGKDSEVGPGGIGSRENNFITKYIVNLQKRPIISFQTVERRSQYSK